MTLRKIVTLPDPILRKKARKVDVVDAETQKLIEDMVETMREAPGVGLAAPQIGLPLRVIVVEFGDEDDDEVPPKVYAVVNPEITRYSNETVLGTEGCLSIPLVQGEVERAEEVTVKGLNRYGKPFKLKAKGWLARIFQHEVDHLDGVLFTDKAEKVWMVPAEGSEDEDPVRESSKTAAAE